MVQDIYSLSMLGGMIAALFAGRLLLSKMYPRTWWYVCRYSAAFWNYALYYFALGTLVTWLLLHTWLARTGPIAGIPVPLLIALAVGILGTLAKTSMVGAMPGIDNFHDAFRAILMLLEPSLQQVIRDEYFAVKRVIIEYENRWGDLDEVKAVIDRNIPDKIEDSERLVFVQELEKTTNAEGALLLYLRFVGSRGFLDVFGEPPMTARLMPVETHAK